MLCLLKLTGTVSSLFTSSSFTLDFRLAKSVFLAKSDASTPLTFFM